MESEMIGSTIRTPRSSRFNVGISTGIGVIVLIALATILVSFAKNLPEIINQPFVTAQAANDFTVAGGTWAVNGGGYQLTPATALGATDSGNANISTNKKDIAVGTWRFSSDVKMTPGSGLHDASLLFDYVDAFNYYFVNISDTASDTTNGIFRMQNGKQTKLASLPATFSTGTNYTIEIEKKDATIKVYDATGSRKFLVKADGTSYAKSHVGYGSRGGADVFDNLLVNGDGAVASPTPNPDPQPEPQPPVSTPTTPEPPVSMPTPTPLPSGGRGINVANSEQLASAITNAQPGDVITLADGTYGGEKQGSYKGSMVSPIANGGKYYTASFTASKAGTAAKPIVLQGSRKAIIDGGGPGSHYGLYFIHADYWQVKGLTVANAAKGVVMDRSTHVLLDAVEVTNIGWEAVHFRDFSADGIIQNSYVHKTGQKNTSYGEAIYIGSANSNWGTYSEGQPDASDRVKVIGNTIADFAAEGLDIKEGSTGGMVAGNTFGGGNLQGENSGDSWVDVKGNNYTFENNRGFNLHKAGSGKESQLAGIQIHQLANGWGNNNIFRNNTLDVRGGVTQDGKATGAYGFWVDPKTSGNMVYCSNAVTNASLGFGNLACKQ